jgi:hypothetical protein
MFSVRVCPSKAVAWAIIAAFVAVTTPVPVAAQAVPAEDQAVPLHKQGTLQGVVYSEGMKSRVTNAVVKIRNLNNQREYTSQPTDPKGNYKILMVEEGWYTLGVTTPAGDFNLSYGVYIKAGEVAKLSVEMLPGGMLEGKGSNGTGKGFFSKPEGILLIVALAGGAAFGIYELTKKEEEASPIR